MRRARSKNDGSGSFRGFAARRCGQIACLARRRAAGRRKNSSTMAGGPVWRGVRSTSRVCGTAKPVRGAGVARPVHVLLAARVAGLRHRHADAGRRQRTRRARGGQLQGRRRSHAALAAQTARSSIWILRASPNAPTSATTSSSFLITATPQQVRDLAATQGYFTPVVRTDVRTVDNTRRVTVSVDPGPQTIIKSVSLSFRRRGADRRPGAGKRRALCVFAARRRAVLAGRLGRREKRVAARRCSRAAIWARRFTTPRR